MKAPSAIQDEVIESPSPDKMHFLYTSNFSTVHLLCHYIRTPIIWYIPFEGKEIIN